MSSSRSSSESKVTHLQSSVGSPEVGSGGRQEATLSHLSFSWAAWLLDAAVHTNDHKFNARLQ